MSLLQLDGFTVRRGDAVVVNDVQLRVEQGEALAVLGDNGAGKSSLLAGIMGLAPASGALRIDGRDAARLSTHRRVRAGLGYCPEDRGLFPGLSARETLAAAYRQGTDRPAAVSKCLALFPELAQRADAPSWQLSGGEQQMLSLARALVGRPRLLLLDEPSLGLAPALRQRLAELLAGLIGSGIGLLLVEQDPDFAKSLCRRSILLVQGRVSESSERGQPREMVAASHNNEMRNI